MKSVIQEASTIAKAIEQGWIKAGKPKDFTIKIFEEPKKNFFGFTTKKAKVGIFIEERQRNDSRPKKHVPPHRRQQHQRKDRQWSSDQQRHDGRPSFHDRDKQRHHEDYRKHDKQEHPQHNKHDDSQVNHEHEHHDRDDHKKNNN
jgi:predicted RNA-binding protein Jag